MADPTPSDPVDLPIQPTGSGVADTEIAMMQAALAEEADANAADEAPAGVRP